MNRPYAFYKSLRFRFGAVFGSLFLLFLLLIAFFLYLHVRRQFENGFRQYLASGAALVLSKTELNPLTIPVPQNGEQFVLLYDNGQTIDTLFPPLAATGRQKPANSGPVRTLVSARQLETGGRIIIQYTRSAEELEAGIRQLKSILFLYLPVAFLLALLAGYSLSGFLLRPIGKLINRANQNALGREIQLLPVPEVEDELHALTQSLNHMLSRLQESRRQQNAFFASAAHELRTPLSIMLTGLQVSRLETVNPATRELIDREVREVQRLSGLVDNLLLMSRLASGRDDRVDPGNSRADLAEAVMEQVKLLSVKSAARHQLFKIELMPDEGDFMVWFQPSHLSILLRNLLDNAIIHGIDENTIQIQLNAQPGQAIRLIVSNDTDQKKMDIELLSREFEKGDHFREGFGLGLWIVKELAKLNHAEVTFEFTAPAFTASVLFTEDAYPSGAMPSITLHDNPSQNPTQHRLQ